MATPQVNPETAIIERNVLSLKERAESIVVRTQQDYVAAANMVVEGRGFIKRWENVFAETIRSAKEHLDRVRNELKSHTVAVQEIVDGVEKKAEAWKAEERRAAQAEQDRLNAEAKRKQDEQAEADRIAAEAKAKEDRVARVADIRGQLKRGEIGKRQAEKLLRAAGAIEEAQLAAASAAADEAKAAPAPEVKVEAAVPKVAGIKGRVNQKFQVVDAAKVPREWCRPDEVRIGEKIRSMKNPKMAMALIPGIRVWEEDSI